jgi:hypothetical protein
VTHRRFYIITLAAFALAITAAVAHEMPGISKEHQAWYSNAETTPEARKRVPYSKCCAHAEVFRTQFRVNKTNGADEWWYLVGEAWLHIPADIVHPHDVHAPDGQPTLFIYQGTLTCFFVGESGG